MAHRLTGGIELPENKRQSLDSGLLDLALPAKLIFPLNSHMGTEARPIVTVGDRVLKGQCIAQADGFISANIHASSSGVVSAIETAPILHPANNQLAQATCIQIATDGLDQWHPECQQQLDSKSIDYQQYDRASIIQRITQAGIIGMGGAGFPSHVKIASDKPIDTLIINAAECEPYITADHCLIINHCAKIIEGIKILAHCIGQQPLKVVIGIENNKPGAIALLQQATQYENNIEVIDFDTCYPSGGEKQLIQIITGIEIASGQLPTDNGILVHNIGTAVAIYDAVVHNNPLISRITTVAGEALSKQANINVLIGTQVHDIMVEFGLKTTADQPARVIIGGPMMGYKIDNLAAPIDKATNCILAPTIEELAPPEPALPCIRCGFCAEVCPVSLLPQQLLLYSEHHNETQLMQHNLFDCIECGACAYVCPSQIPLVQYYRTAKGEIETHAQEKQFADKSRQRFEFRSERLEHEQQLKQQRRQQRQQSAELKQADQQRVQQAIDKIKQQQQAQPTTEELDKLERQIITLTERIANYHSTINDSAIDDTDKIAALEAKCNNTQARLDTVLERKAQLTATET